MLGVAIGSFVLLLAVAYMIARPLFVPQVPAEAEEDAKEAALLACKQRQLADIRELDLDLATGKLTEQDHRELRARSIAEAAAAMKALDEARESLASHESEPAPQDGRVSVTDDELERAIAARKRALGAFACPDCGAASDPTDHFCRSCGAEVNAAQIGRT